MISSNKNIISRVQVKQNKKTLYHFIIFVTINEKLIRKDRSIHTSVNVQREETIITQLLETLEGALSK